MILRITNKIFEGIKDFLKGDMEKFCFLLCSKANPLFLAKECIFPEHNEIQESRHSYVKSSNSFYRYVVKRAIENKLNLIDIHSHPWRNGAFLSSLDRSNFKLNMDFMKHHYPNIEMGMVVFDPDMKYDGMIMGNGLNRIEIHGSRIEILSKKETTFNKCAQFLRQYLIPGWNQDIIESLSLGIIGLGGIGSLVLESIINIGFGKRGKIILVDPDRIEESNISRIPYAKIKDIGRQKVKIAKKYAKGRARIKSISASVGNKISIEHLKECNVLLGCSDSEGARKLMNEISIKYLIPYIDMGTEIFPKNNSHDAGGQVRVVIPDETGCLICHHGIDLKEAALDLMTKEQRNIALEKGYIKDTSISPAPALINLNGIIANLGVGMLIKIIHGTFNIENSYTVYDNVNVNIRSFKTEPNEECPACSSLAIGDEKGTISELPEMESYV